MRFAKSLALALALSLGCSSTDMSGNTDKEVIGKRKDKSASESDDDSSLGGEGSATRDTSSAKKPKNSNPSQPEPDKDLTPDRPTNNSKPSPPIIPVPQPSFPAPSSPPPPPPPPPAPTVIKPDAIMDGGIETFHDCDRCVQRAKQLAMQVGFTADKSKTLNLGHYKNPSMNLCDIHFMRNMSDRIAEHEGQDSTFENQIVLYCPCNCGWASDSTLPPFDDGYYP